MDKMRSGFTVAPFLVALLSGLLALPMTDVVKVNAYGMGFEHLQPWRGTSQDGVVARALNAVSLGTQSVLQALWGHPLRGPAMAAAAAIAAVHFGLDGGHPGAMLAIGALTAAETRTQLLAEAEKFRNADGTFPNDQARASFDAKLAEIEALDGRSEFIAERNPLDGGNPSLTQRRADDPPQPNERDLGADGERDRIQGILVAVRAARLPQSVADRLIKDKTPLVRAQAEVFGELSKRENDDAGPRPGPQDVRLGTDPLVHVRAGIENAIQHRVAPNYFKLEDVGREYRGMSLMDVAKVHLNGMNKRTTGMSRMEIAGLALGLDFRSGYHTTSDFALLLADVARKTLRAAYEEAPQTFQPIARRVTLSDFKVNRRLQLGDAPNLELVKEHGEFTRGTIGEGSETMQLETFGRIFAITRQALVNDDTDAFARVPMLFGRAARKKESDIVWAQITDNPTMGDGNSLFSAAHGNLQTDGDVLSIASLSRARLAIRLQTGVDGETQVNVVPKFLVVPPSLETLAEQLVAPLINAQVFSAQNIFAGKLTVIVEPRLEANSSQAWYVVADPSQVDVLEYAYLEGENGPAIENRVGFDVDGLEIKCRLDFDAAAVDWRGLHKDPGEDVS